MARLARNPSSSRSRMSSPRSRLSLAGGRITTWREPASGRLAPSASAASLTVPPVGRYVHGSGGRGGCRARTSVPFVVKLHDRDLTSRLPHVPAVHPGLSSGRRGFIAEPRPLKVIFAAMKWDYGDPARGLS